LKSYETKGFQFNLMNIVITWANLHYFVLGYDLTVEVSSKYLDIFKSEKFSNLFEDQVIFSDLLVLA